MKIICGEDCGNAPKKALLKKLQTLLAQGDIEGALEYMADGFVCDAVGRKRTVGKDAFTAAFGKALQADRAKELVIENIITHGSTGAVNGRMTTGKGRVRAYCDVYAFTGASAKAKVESITRYAIDFKAGAGPK